MDQSATNLPPTTQPSRNIFPSWMSQFRTVNTMTKIILFAGIGVCILAVLLLVFLPKKSKKESGVTIAGTVIYTALKPDPQDRGELQIWYRIYGTGDEFTIAVKNPSPYETTWSWQNAVSGVPYELRADLVIDGKIVAQSEPLVVSAPALNQPLELRVTWHDLPESVVREQTTSIEGTARINGVIPDTASLIIQSMSGDSTQTVVTIPNPTSQTSWIWKETKPLQDYQLKAVLTSGGTEIGSSQTIEAAGGDSSIDFSINSSALPPQRPPPTPSQSVSQATATPMPSSDKGTISGTVTVNGPEKEGTSLLMLWRYPGEANYKEIQRINNPTHNGQSWSFPNQTVGKQYEITAVLQVNLQNTASTQSQTVTAPASSINFTLNTGVFVPTPGGSLTVNTCNNLGNNQYNAVLSYPRQSDAGNYWFQVGRYTGGSDLYNGKVQDSGASPQITVQIDGNRSYYARYAYALCKTCSDDQNFSNFSNISPFSCGGGTIYTGYVCASSFTCQQTTENNPPYAFTNAGLTQCQRDCRPTPTPTASPAPTNSPTPTPKIAECNQSCVGNGYICRDPLVCTIQGGIGSSLCRNADCQDEESCVCPAQ